MDDQKKIIKARLKETFKNDSQEVVARKLFTSQGNVSKWLNGQMPTTDNLLNISRAYHVSIDWLLGISDEKEIDGVVLEKLTYEHAARIIDRMIVLGILEIPDLSEIARQHMSDGRGLVSVPQYDSDYIKIKDRMLSFILRRRYKIYEVGEDMVDFWKNKSLPYYRGIRLLRYTKEIKKLIDSKSWSSFADADWVVLVKDIENMSEEDILIELNNKDKDGENDGN